MTGDALDRRLEQIAALFASGNLVPSAREFRRILSDRGLRIVADSPVAFRAIDRGDEGTSSYRYNEDGDGESLYVGVLGNLGLLG